MLIIHKEWWGARFIKYQTSDVYKFSFKQPLKSIYLFIYFLQKQEQERNHKGEKKIFPSVFVYSILFIYKKKRENKNPNIKRMALKLKTFALRGNLGFVLLIFF